MRNDPDRLAELKRRAILDTTRERAYDELARLLASSLEVPITMVNFLDAERDWFKAAVGLPHSESPALTSFCEAFFSSPDDLIIAEDTRADARFAAHPLVTGAPFIRFYAAARLTAAGQTLGTLCAYDVQPRTITPAQIETLRALAHAAIEMIRLRPATAAAPQA